MPATTSVVRTTFFEYLFGASEGYVCIATASPDKKDFKQTFFQWPANKAALGSFIEQATYKKNVWFCTSLLERPERKKEFCLPGSLVWADLDECHPGNVEPTPSAILESSPGRYQALWRLDEVVEPYIQEDFSKRIAYKYVSNGADPSGWDLTQLLRVPLTSNFKYVEEGIDIPKVKLSQAAETKVPIVLFESIERPVGKAGQAPDTATAADSMPDPNDLPDATNVLYKFYAQLNSNVAFKSIYQTEPKEGEDWSRVLWRLLNICLEVGMTEEETFAIALTSKCNKYARDNRPPVHLWEDVVRASLGQQKFTAITHDFQALTMPILVTDDELAKIPRTFVDEYRDWASEATDAVVEFHDLCAFMLLSSSMAGGIELKTSYGEMVPNLWGLVLGDSTLSRKTTAMRMAMDMLVDIDSELILATDGSAEGLLSGLSTRPNRASLYFKDEVSGFFDSINRKDYLAGMPEMLAQLYDVPRVLSRRLRKETITINSPVFIFFGGGIRDKVYSLVSDEYILSGFLPRFLVVSGEADLTRIRRTGPGLTSLSNKRTTIQQKVADLYETFNRAVTVKVGGEAMEVHARNEALLTPEAWEQYGHYEEVMVKAAYDSSVAMLALPTFERMSRSLLKMAVLLAGAERPPQEGKFQVEAYHVKAAASYIQRWGRYSVELVLSAGTGTNERLLQRVLQAIEKQPGVTRSWLMQRHKLSKREMDEVMGTLIDRGQVNPVKLGRGVAYTVIT